MLLLPPRSAGQKLPAEILSYYEGQQALHTVVPEVPPPEVDGAEVLEDRETPVGAPASESL